MGTNYYAVSRKPKLNRDFLHVGKSSAGWMFLFHGYLDEPLIIKSIEDWYKTIREKDLVIFNEYGDEVELNDFINMVMKMQVDNSDNPENFAYDVVNVDGYRFSFKDFG